MKPTMFAEELRASTGPQDLRVFAAVLPTRCTTCHGAELEWVHDDVDICRPCDGRGFTYPDPPDWWHHDGYFRTTDDWHDYLHLTWRTLGLIEEQP